MYQNLIWTSLTDIKAIKSLEDKQKTLSYLSPFPSPKKFIILKTLV